MKYNFDERIERRGTGCVKWDEEAPLSDAVLGGSATPSDAVLGGSAAEKELIPLWVADMDFASLGFSGGISGPSHANIYYILLVSFRVFRVC